MTFASAGELNKVRDWIGASLVELFNGILGVLPVKRFMNREAVLKPIWAALAPWGASILAAEKRNATATGNFRNFAHGEIEIWWLVFGRTSPLNSASKRRHRTRAVIGPTESAGSGSTGKDTAASRLTMRPGRVAPIRARSEFGFAFSKDFLTSLSLPGGAGMNETGCRQFVS